MINTNQLIIYVRKTTISRHAIINLNKNGRISYRKLVTDCHEIEEDARPLAITSVNIYENELSSFSNVFINLGNSIVTGHECMGKQQHVKKLDKSCKVISQLVMS